MATFKIWNINQRMGKRIRYICQDEKTENGKYISALNCPEEPAACIQQMKDTKQFYRKETGVLLYHAVQSFKPGEVTPEEAHEIALEFARRTWGDQYEVLIATHTDREHIHTHFQFNSVSFVDGKKYHDGGKRNLDYLRGISDEICKRHNLSINKEQKPSIRITSNEYQMQMNEKKPVRAFIREDIDEAINLARNLPEFISILKDMDYEVDGSGKYLKVRPYGKERFFRLYKLGNAYSEEEIIRRIQERKQPQQKQSPARKNPELRQKQKSRIALLAYSKKRSFVSDILRTYLYYRNILKRVQKDKYPGRPPLYLREDLQQLQKYSGEAILLARNGIRTVDQLAGFQNTLKQKMNDLNDRRQAVRKKLRTVTDEGEISVLKNEADFFTRQIKVVYREQKLCEDIGERYQAFQKKITHTVRQLEQPVKTVTKNKSEPFTTAQFNQEK